MSEHPIAEAMLEFNERVAKPWAEEMARRFQALGTEIARLQAETRAKGCPCGCGRTLGEVMGDSVLNHHMLLPRPSVGVERSGEQ